MSDMIKERFERLEGRTHALQVVLFHVLSELDPRSLLRVRAHLEKAESAAEHRDTDFAAGAYGVYRETIDFLKRL